MIVIKLMSYPATMSEIIIRNNVQVSDLLDELCVKNSKTPEFVFSTIIDSIFINRCEHLRRTYSLVAEHVHEIGK